KTNIVMRILIMPQGYRATLLYRASNTSAIPKRTPNHCISGVCINCSLKIVSHSAMSRILTSYLPINFTRAAKLSLICAKFEIFIVSSAAGNNLNFHQIQHNENNYAKLLLSDGFIKDSFIHMLNSPSPEKRPYSFELASSLLSLVLIIAVLYFLQSVLVPLMFSILIAISLYPVTRFLE